MRLLVRRVRPLRSPSSRHTNDGNVFCKLHACAAAPPPGVARHAVMHDRVPADAAFLAHPYKKKPGHLATPGQSPPPEAAGEGEAFLVKTIPADLSHAQACNSACLHARWQRNGARRAVTRREANPSTRTALPVRARYCREFPSKLPPHLIDRRRLPPVDLARGGDGLPRHTFLFLSALVHGRPPSA